jgi:ferredoxin
MQLKRVNLVYFSPTGNVYKTIRKIGEGIALPTTEYDLTSFNARWGQYSFGSNELVVIGMPVYGGRIPAITTEFFRCLHPEQTPAVYIVSYGNRAYEDALLELKQTSEKRGFYGIAAAAFVGEPAYCEPVNSGHSNGPDQLEEFQFGRNIRAKIDALSEGKTHESVKVNGNFPYRRRNELADAPKTNDYCNHCGICINECPMRAINPDDPKEVDGLRCLTCFRCVRICPEKAKYFDNELIKSRIAHLAENYGSRKKPDLFL